MAAGHESCRVAIYAKVTDIEGDPQSRYITLGQAFCSIMLLRDLRSKVQPDGYNACHVPAYFNSDNEISIYFLFNIGVKGPLSKYKLLQTPHFVYFASRARGD